MSAGNDNSVTMETGTLEMTAVGQLKEHFFRLCLPVSEHGSLGLPKSSWSHKSIWHEVSTGTGLKLLFQEYWYLFSVEAKIFYLNFTTEWLCFLAIPGIFITLTLTSKSVSSDNKIIYQKKTTFRRITEVHLPVKLQLGSSSPQMMRTELIVISHFCFCQTLIEAQSDVLIIYGSLVWQLKSLWELSRHVYACWHDSSNLW